MSVQTNQFLIYGVQLDKSNVTDEFYNKYGEYLDDSAFKSTVNHKNGIFCIFDGMGGQFLIVGKVIEKSSDGELIDGPIEINTALSKKEKAAVKASIQDNFSDVLPNSEWACDYIFVTQYR